jgi:tRNA pseudouridine38-40 synthase
MQLEGDGFLRHMVRNVAGTVVEIGIGRRPVDAMAEILASRSRTRAGATAPASGLFLRQVLYSAKISA